MKANLKVPAITAAVVILAIAASILLRGRDGAGESDASDTIVATGSVDHPEAVSTTRAPVRSSPARGGVARTEALAEVQEQVNERTRMRREHDERSREAFTQSMERYAAEPVDPVWAASKAGTLTAIASKPEFEVANANPTSLNIDCRKSMCKLDAQFADRMQAENWIMMYTSSVGSEMPSSLASRNQNQDGSVHVEVYGRAR